MSILLHNSQSWPDDITNYIDQHKLLIRSYVETSKKCEPCFDPDKLYFPNEEILEESKIKCTEFEAFSNALRRLLNPHRLEMVHCTKLLPHEIENIKNNGLRILTTELVKERINAVFEQGYLNEQERDFLLADYQRKLKNSNFQARQNQLWFVTPKHLGSELCGAGRLFTSWGGESVYNEHDSMQTHIAGKLKTMGIPCIVKAKVLIADLQHGNIINAMIYTSGVAANLGYFPEFHDTDGDIEGFVNKDLEGKFIEEIIDFYDPKFSEIYNEGLLARLEVDLSTRQSSNGSKNEMLEQHV